MQIAVVGIDVAELKQHAHCPTIGSGASAIPAAAD
jgi:hypothetical protein